MGLFVCRISAECVWCGVWLKEREIYSSFQDLGEQLLQQIKPALDPGTEIKSDCFLFLLLVCITAPWWERTTVLCQCYSSTAASYFSKAKLFEMIRLFWSTLKVGYLQSTSYRHKWEVEGKLADMTRVTSTKARLDMLVEVERQHCNSPPGFGFWGWKTRRQTEHAELAISFLRNPLTSRKGWIWSVHISHYYQLQ